MSKPRRHNRRAERDSGDGTSRRGNKSPQRNRRENGTQRKEGNGDSSHGPMRSPVQSPGQSNLSGNRSPLPPSSGGQREPSQYVIPIFINLVGIFIERIGIFIKFVGIFIERTGILIGLTGISSKWVKILIALALRVWFLG